MLLCFSGCGSFRLRGQADTLQNEIERLERELEEQKKQNELLNLNREQLENQIKEQKEQNALLNSNNLNLRDGFYSLSDAYRLGMISDYELMSIAYSHAGGRKYNEAVIPNNFIPVYNTTENLDKETEFKINEYIAKDDNIYHVRGEISAYYGKYYSTWHRFFVVYITENKNATETYIQTINNLKFYCQAGSYLAVLSEKDFS